jgi:DNA polymerase-4
LFNQILSRRVRIRLIGVSLSGLIEGGRQCYLFDSCGKDEKLYDAMDKIRNTYGDRYVIRASSLDSHTIGRENPFDGDCPPLLANRKK